MIDNKPYWENKQKRAARALAHTKEMEKYPLPKTSMYEFAYTDNGGEMPNNSVIETDSVSAVFDAVKGNENKKICVLNFASYKNPGGMFIKGSSAQEESLCMESNLYNALREETEFYKWNNEHKNKALYMNRALYSENVRFERDGKIVYCDVLTCACPNKGAAQKYANVSDEENSETLKSRIKFIRYILENNNVNVAILGAYGCGVFRQDPKEVAEIFNDVFRKTTIKDVIYAIPGGFHKENLVAFRKIFEEP